jgi:hypothetical protein
MPGAVPMNVGFFADHCSVFSPGLGRRYPQITVSTDS